MRLPRGSSGWARVSWERLLYHLCWYDRLWVIHFASTSPSVYRTVMAVMHEAIWPIYLPAVAPCQLHLSSVSISYSISTIECKYRARWENQVRSITLKIRAGLYTDKASNFGLNRVFGPVLIARSIDYKYEHRKNVSVLRNDNGELDISLDSLFQKTPIIAPQKTNRSARKCLWRCRCLELSNFIGLFTSLWNKYHVPMAFWHRVHSDKCIISVLFQDEPLFHCLKANRGLELSRNLGTQENRNCLIYIVYGNTRSSFWGIMLKDWTD
jgi:hypothetical protein